MAYNSLISRTDMGGMIPVEYAREIIQGTTEQSAVMRLGRRLRDMTTQQRTMPVLSALPLAYFVNGDTGLKKTSEVNWEGITITAEELAVIVPIPQSALDDNQFPIWDEVKPLAQEAAGLAFDQAVLYGTNAPASWPGDILATAVAASNTVALGTGADLYEDLLGENGVIALLEAEGYVPDGHIGAVTLKSKLRGTRDANGQPIFKTSMQDQTRYELDGSPILFPLNGAVDVTASLLVSGSWRTLVYAVRQDISWFIADQGVIQDAGGSIVYNLFQQDMVALRLVLRLGWQLPNPVNRIQGTKASRCAFAVLTP